VSDKFKKRLEAYVSFAVTAELLDPRQPPTLDVRAPRLICQSGRPVGLADAAVATMHVRACESHRLLAAVLEVMGNLVSSTSSEQSMAALIELEQAGQVVAAHLDESARAIGEAARAVRQAGPPHISPRFEPPGGVH
jgi:hypothetical protein